MTHRDSFQRALTRRTVLGGALAAGLGVAGLAGAGVARATEGLTIVSSNRTSSRDLIATVRSAELSRTVKVRILLPVGYDDNPSLRYPVIHLLHGTNGSEEQWLQTTSVRQQTEDKPVIVVMPDGGRAGWYSNHWHTDKGPLNWESFHIGQLLQTIDDNLRTIRDPAARAIIGFSGGAYGAAIYGGRHPELFSSISCYSGPLDSFDMQWRQEMYDEPTLDGERAGAIYGTTPGNERYEDLVDRNPGTYADRLTNHRIRLYCGDAQGYEGSMRRSTAVYYSRLVAAGARNVRTALIPGADHNMANADQALARDLPGVLQHLWQPRTV